MVSRILNVIALCTLTMIVNACLESGSEDTHVLAMNPVTGDIESFSEVDSVPDGWVLCPDGGCVEPACTLSDCGDPLEAPMIICAEVSWSFYAHSKLLRLTSSKLLRLTWSSRRTARPISSREKTPRIRSISGTSSSSKSRSRSAKQPATTIPRIWPWFLKAMSLLQMRYR